MKCITKPTVLEAFQWTGNNTPEIDAFLDRIGGKTWLSLGVLQIVIGDTLIGEMHDGDYLIFNPKASWPYVYIVSSAYFDEHCSIVEN